MHRIRKSWIQFVHVVGFSNGCAEFTLAKPPPLVPSSLMASWLAIGPPVTCCSPPVNVDRVVPSVRFWIAPPAIRKIVATTQIGSSSRIVIRVRSTQKLPNSSVRLRAKPRTSATATAMPTAAETKFCTARPAI